MKRSLILCYWILLALLFQGCASMTPSEEDINAQALKAFNEVRSNSQISNNKEWTLMLDRVASRVAKASGEDFDWEWVLIESPQVNAWCMPGGKIAVYTGIMPVLQTEGALAAVLGHEVAHATRRHGKKRYARAIRGNLAGAVIGTATVIGGQLMCKSESCRVLTGMGGAAAGFAVAFFDRQFSREDETEADEVGQIYMARAGYDPSEAIPLWERMNAASGGQAPPEWMSTHPSDETRKKNLNKWLPNAKEIYREAPQQFGIGEKIR